MSLVVCGLGAAVAGALVAAIPGWLKARFAVNEIITTLAMNFIVISVLGWLLSGPFKGGYASLPQSDLVPENAALPVLISETRAHYGLLVALAFVPFSGRSTGRARGYRLGSSAPTRNWPVSGHQPGPLPGGADGLRRGRGRSSRLDAGRDH